MKISIEIDFPDASSMIEVKERLRAIRKVADSYALIEMKYLSLPRELKELKGK